VRAVVDLNACLGYANCVVEADAIFDFDDQTEKPIILVDPIPDELLEDAENAVAACPMNAITLEP
jgi:ferredoxin